ncbi:hypothetical protein CCY99_07755 [Helicobacter sp. 16-1353]|uniref:DUF6056 family protein n=1 Tax=Helicobacter sp. 16-1353 TaxID=2004996 RepID=UPI000DCF2F48|nr:DUF6056 family protein [Helicobacter sp. 16-1353]RAX52037.1 hypothetical protein CCY99_07755 [Helicobacter sp. 16-1353]
MASEQIGIITIIALLFLYIFLRFYKKIKIPSWFVIGIIFFIIGYLCLYLSPGHHARSQLKVFEGVYLSIPQLIDLGFYEKLKRVFITLNNFKSRMYIIFVLLIFTIYYMKSINLNSIKRKILYGFLYILSITIILIINNNFFVVLYGICFILLLILMKKDRIFIPIFIIHLLFLLTAMVTIQFPSLPARARLGDSLMLIGGLGLFINAFLSNSPYRDRIYKLISVLICVYGIYVASAYVTFRLDWNNMVKLIESQKNLGNLDIEVDDIFHSYYSNFSNWGNIGKNAKDWPNPSYAKMFGINSIKIKD